MTEYSYEICSFDWLWLRLVMTSLHTFSVLKIGAGVITVLILVNRSSKHFLKVRVLLEHEFW